MRSTAAAFAALSLPLMAGGTETGGGSRELVNQPEESRLHFVLKTGFASRYTTPHGMIERDEGLTIQQLLPGIVDL